MKRLLFLLILLSFLIENYSQDHHQAATRQTVQAKLTTADWQSDLKFFQQTIHRDYPYLFKRISAKEFDAEVKKLYLQIPTLQDHQRMAGIARIVSSFKWGHTDILWRESPVKYHIVPLNFYWFSDGLFVEGCDKKYQDLAGAKVVKIEGKPVDKALAAIRPLVPAENDQFFKAYGLDFLAIPEALHSQAISAHLKKTVTYTFEKDGKLFDRTMEAVDAFRFPRQYGFTNNRDWASARNQSTTPLYLKNLDKIYYYEYLPESKTVYVRQSQVLDDTTESLAVFYKKVFDFIEQNEVDRLVLDVRLNGGGNNYKNKPIIISTIQSKINKPGKFFVITGRRTFSACQNLVNELHNYTNVVFVGEPTAESINFYGDTRKLELPKTRIPILLSFAWWQDKPQWEDDEWMAPHVATEMSFEQYKTNQDPALAACLAFSDNDLVLDPMNHLRQLFVDGKLDELESTAKKMVRDPKYRYVKFEEKLNLGGYELLNKKQIEPALYVFELNTKLYPSSPNVWDSFAEANWIANKPEKAIEYYNKAISMDPDGPTGENARRMLEKLKREYKTQ